VSIPACHFQAALNACAVGLFDQVYLVKKSAKVSTMILLHSIFCTSAPFLQVPLILCLRKMSIGQLWVKIKLGRFLQASDS